MEQSFLCYFLGVHGKETYSFGSNFMSELMRTTTEGALSIYIPARLLKSMKLAFCLDTFPHFCCIFVKLDMSIVFIKLESNVRSCGNEVFERLVSTYFFGL